MAGTVSRVVSGNVSQVVCLVLLFWLPMTKCQHLVTALVPTPQYAFDSASGMRSCSINNHTCFNLYTPRPFVYQSHEVSQPLFDFF